MRMVWTISDEKVVSGFPFEGRRGSICGISDCGIRSDSRSENGGDGSSRFCPHGLLQTVRRSIWLLLSLSVSSVAGGHALGNFTLNHVSILELTSDRIIQHALVDFAEVPSFEQFSAIDADENRIVTSDELNDRLNRLIPEVASNYRLRIDNQRIQLQFVEYTPRLSEGVARVTCIQVLSRWEATLPKETGELAIQFENRAYEDRMGRSDVRLLWSPDWELIDVEPSGNATFEAAADFSNSVFLAETRTVHFSVRRKPQASSLKPPASSLQPLGSGFDAFDPYIVDNMIPPDILKPDNQGRYKIFHVRLAQDIASGKSVAQASSLKPQVSSDAVSTTARGGETYGAGKLGEAEKKFSEFIHAENVGPAMLLTMILLSFVYGAVHALSPGHGKTIVAAYLVGTQGNLRKGVIQAVYLGVIVTLSHVFVVLAVGLIALTLTAGVLSPRVTFGLQIASGVLVMSIGIPMLVRRYKVYFLAKVQAALTTQEHPHHQNHPHNGEPARAHTHEHDQPHDHRHSHEHRVPHVPPDASWWGLLALGVTGGMVPCLGAVVVFLIGVGYGKVGLGLTLIVSFSVGLAAVLIAVGITMVLCKQLLERTFDWFDTRFGRRDGSARTFFQFGMPVVAAVLVTLLGAGICIRALIQGGYLVINV